MSSFPLVIEHCSPSKTGHFYLAETGHYHSAVTGSVMAGLFFPQNGLNIIPSLISGKGISLYFIQHLGITVSMVAAPFRVRRLKSAATVIYAKRCPYGGIFKPAILRQF
jgi:hypothetical protein